MSNENLIQVTEEPSLEELFSQFYALYDEVEGRSSSEALDEPSLEEPSLEELFSQFYALYAEVESR